MPRADRVPNMVIETVSTLCTHNGLGVKGCGEVGTIGSPATVINAVVDALVASRRDACGHAGDAEPHLARHQQRAHQPERREGGDAMRAVRLSPSRNRSRRRRPCSPDDQAKPLAGGMTLAADDETAAGRAGRAGRSRRRLPGLSGIERAGNGISTIGAMTTHDAVAASEAVRKAIPALAALAGGIGDPQVRNRGTIGGSIANNDPTADYPAAVLGAWRDDRDRQARDRGRRFLQGLVRDRAAARRDHHGGALSRSRRPRATRSFPIRRRAMRIVGVFVAKFPRRRACRGDRRGPCVFRAPARWKQLWPKDSRPRRIEQIPSIPAAARATSTPMPNIART